jgi:hypothetical protein
MILSIHDAFYIEMLAFHVAVIIDRTERFNVELKSSGQKGDKTIQEKTDSILNCLQDVVSHTASISKYFWPVRRKSVHEDRGKRLKKVFSISDNSPVSNRGVRDALEHFDERLDLFLASSPVGTIYPGYVGSRKKASAQNTHCFRAYFVDDQVFKVLDTEIHMPPIYEEIAKIKKILESQINNGLRFS